MARLRMTFHYAVREFTLLQELLGASVTVPAGADVAEIAITFPLNPAEDDPDDKTASPAPAFTELFPVREDLPLVDGARDLRITMSSRPAEPDPNPPVAVDLVRVEVFLNVEGVSANDWTPDGAPQGVHARLQAAVARADAIADQAVEETIAWTRVHRRQTWLGLYGESPERTGSDEVVDLDAGRRLPWPARADMSIKAIERDSPWSSTNLGELTILLASRKPPPLADTLLADAQYLITWATPRDASRALLIAAVACEVKIKDVLRHCASPDQQQLVEMLLENPRDWSMAAASLFHKPLGEIAGTSLKDADVELYKRVVLLFERRNDLAHRGIVPEFKVAWDAIKAAQEVFSWLEELVANNAAS